jgi:hypothetical protein
MSGDTAFNERMLPIFPHTDIAAWIKTWDKIEALRINEPNCAVKNALEAGNIHPKRYASYLTLIT